MTLIGIVSPRRFQWGSHHRVWLRNEKVIMKTVLFTLSLLLLWFFILSCFVSWKTFEYTYCIADDFGGDDFVKHVLAVGIDCSNYTHANYNIGINYSCHGRRFNPIVPFHDPVDLKLFALMVRQILTPPILPTIQFTELVCCSGLLLICLYIHIFSLQHFLCKFCWIKDWHLF